MPAGFILRAWAEMDGEFMTSKKVYKCATDGVLERVGKLTGICPYIACGSDSICNAHGNTKCDHKSIEVTNASTNNNPEAIRKA